VAFKIESHNHPSAVEPYQGAATGVGGILRDVFTMGARPIAMLNSLRFGSLESARVRYLFAGVVKGIGDYGNCVGIPTVAGEVAFDSSYEGNPLVNAMCVGLMHEDELIRAVAQGVGNPIIAVGARTGRDGIHGASFASEDLSAESDAKRPRVQVGDPFTEKLLLEASLELIRSGAIVAIQDMGAAGLTSSSAEMAARGDVGITIDTTRVPARETGMTPYELLLSESQERMLVVAKRGREAEVEAILGKWDLTTAVIGEVIAEPVYRVTEGDRVVAEFPGTRLVTDCPTYTPEAHESRKIVELRARDVSLVPERQEERDPAWTLVQLLSSPTIASKAWVYRQYDTSVRTNTVVGPGGDAAVVRIRGTERALALKTDCNSRYVYLDPRAGTRVAVCEAARNVACTGARPMAITNNLNFGNPRRPDVYFQLREAVRGMGEACTALGTPVTGGNVSLYNQTAETAILPTPVIAVLGVIDDVRRRTPTGFPAEGEVIVHLGQTREELSGSEWAHVVHGHLGGRPPQLDLLDEANLARLLVEAARGGYLTSSHDLSEGGLSQALVESCLRHGIGATVSLLGDPFVGLFSESAARAIVTVPEDRVDSFLAMAASLGVPAGPIGHTGGSSLTVTDHFEIPLDELSAAWRGTLPAAFD
jgi:phosphoribosylformylglycinamidine synthase